MLNWWDELNSDEKWYYIFLAMLFISSNVSLGTLILAIGVIINCWLYVIVEKLSDK